MRSTSGSVSRLVREASRLCRWRWLAQISLPARSQMACPGIGPIIAWCFPIPAQPRRRFERANTSTGSGSRPLHASGCSNRSGAPIQRAARREDFARDVSATEPLQPEPRDEWNDANTEERNDRSAAGDESLEQRWAARIANRQLPLGLAKAILPPRRRAGGDSASASARWSLRTAQPHQERLERMLGSGGTVGLGQFPATFTRARQVATDFVVFNTGLAGSVAQASIIAFNNLYASCNGGTPTVYWAYNTGGTVAYLRTLSLDGSQVAFVQSSSGSVASLVLLKWKASNGTLTSARRSHNQLAANLRRLHCALHDHDDIQRECQ